MLNTPEFTNDFDQAEIQQYKVMGILGFIPPLFFLPLIATNKSAVGRFWANQGLLTLIVYGAVGVTTGVLNAIFSAIGIEFLSWIISPLNVVGLLFSAFGIVYTAKGRVRELPVIGHFRIFK